MSQLLEKRSVNASDSTLTEEMKTFLNQQAARLQERTDSQRQTVSEQSGVKVLLEGKTSGVTGGAVVEIEKNDERKQYTLKNIFERGQHSGEHFYNPNAKSTTSAFVTRQTLKEVNDSVLKKFIALSLANVASPGVAPDAICGQIEDTVEQLKDVVKEHGKLSTTETNSGNQLSYVRDIDITEEGPAEKGALEGHSEASTPEITKSGQIDLSKNVINDYEAKTE